jgi:HAD superfamily hydrolase (TIGR01509 family)
MKKLIIFDCDGVLVNSESICSRTDAEMLSKIGYSITEEESARKFVGLGYTKQKNIIYEESGIHIPDSYIQTIQATIMKTFETELKPLMLPILTSELLINHSKCVASSSPKERVLFSLKMTGQDSFFKKEHVFTAEQVTHTKPAPDLFLLAAEKMGFSPKDCLVIEDSVVGIEAAQAAKMPVIGFLGGDHTRFAWYKERILNKKVPIAHNQLELLNLILLTLNEELSA